MKNKIEVKNLILVPFDFTEKSDVALKNASFLAKKLDYKLTLLHVYTRKSSVEFTDAQQGHRLISERLKKNADKITEDHALDVDFIIRDGDIYKTIGITAEAIRAKFVVMGIAPKKGMHKIMTSRAMKVVEHCPVPIIVSQIEGDFKGLKNILFTAGMSAQVRQKVGWCSIIAEACKSKVHIFKFREKNEDDIFRLKGVTRQIREYFAKRGIESDEATAEEAINFGEQVVKYAHIVDAGLIAIMVTQAKFFNFEYGDYDEKIMFNRVRIPVMLINPKQYDRVSIPTLF